MVFLRLGCTNNICSPELHYSLTISLINIHYMSRQNDSMESLIFERRGIVRIL
jgi:hypothetical protein